LGLHVRDFGSNLAADPDDEAVVDEAADDEELELDDIPLMV